MNHSPRHHRSVSRLLIGTAVALLVTPLVAAVPAGAAAGTGVVTGTATYEGAGVAGIVVSAQSPYGQVIVTTTTGSNGAYTLANIPPRTRAICFDGPATTQAPLGYAFTCYRNADEPAAATPVVVGAGTVTTGIDVALDQPVEIDGAVRTAAGVAVAGASVRAFSNEPPVTTDDQGHYRLTVDAADASGGLSVCADASTTAGTGTKYGYRAACVGVTGRAGRTVPAPDIIVAAAAAVGGTVVDGRGQPVTAVRVTVSTPEGDSYAATTAADGSYRVVGVPGGEGVRVGFDATRATGAGGRYGYLSECWRDVAESSPGACADVNGPATVVTTVAGTITKGIDAAIGSASAVKGIVRDAAGHVIPGAVVRVAPVGDPTGGTTTISGNDGTWQIDRLRPGRYTVCSTGRAEQPPRTYGSACLGGGTDPAASPPVTVTANAVATASLVLPGPGFAAGYGSITGRFVDRTGRPVSGLRVAWSSGGEAFRDGVVESLPTGRFRIENVPTGENYRVCTTADADTVPNKGEGLAPICLTGLQPAERGTTDIGTVTVPQGGRVGGHVYDDSGFPLQGWTMSVTDLATGRVTLPFVSNGPAGAYVTAPLAAGTYRICVSGGRYLSDGGTASAQFATRCFNQKASGADTPVVVKTGKRTTAIDFRLPRS